MRIMINMSEYETDDPLFQGRHRETERKAFGDGFSSGSGGGARQESTEQVRGQLLKYIHTWYGYNLVSSIVSK